VVVSSYAVAALMAAQGDLVAAVPKTFARHYATSLGVRWFPLPLDLPELVISQEWHARLDIDPVQQWLRAQVRECTRT
jgi:DNA-binding transcriptional LysR family regulator